MNYILSNYDSFNIYMYNRYRINENNRFLSKDAHRFTDWFARLEMSVRVCFEG